MKVLTITKYDVAEFNRALNDCQERYNVRFCQTHVNAVNGTIHYTAVIYYQDRV